MERSWIFHPSIIQRRGSKERKKRSKLTNFGEPKEETLSLPLSLSLSFSTRLFGRQVGFHDPLEIYAFKEEGQVSKVPANIQWDQLLSAQRHDSPRISV